MGMRLILDRGNERLAVELRDGVYTLGRDERADLTIPNSTVSGRHAEIHVQGATCTLRDLGSSNGTMVNGVRLRGAQLIHPNDDIQLGSAHLTVEASGQASPAVADTKQYRQMSPQEIERATADAAAVVEKPRRRVAWSTRFWLAGALAILVFALLMLLVEAYSQADVQRTQRQGRFMTFAAQYIHPLTQAPAGPIPQPSAIDGLQDPFYVLDANGRILHPPAQPGQPMRPPLLVDPATGRIDDKVKLGLRQVTLPAKSGPSVRAYSYPILHGGDLLGYVVARPGPAQSNLPLISMMVLCTAAIALLALYFAIRPVVGEIREHIVTLTGKISPFAHGFVDALPRSPRVPELNDLATECETVLQSMSRNLPAATLPVAAQGHRHGPLLSPLLEDAALPYCFITNDFHLLSGSADLLSFDEFGRARPGASIFEAGMNSVQSKQLIGAINDARVTGQGRTPTTLRRRGETRPYIALVRRFNDPSTGARGYGLLFAVPPQL